MQAGNGRRTHKTPRLYITRPVDVADHTTGTKGPATGKQLFGPLWHHFRQNQAPGPANGCVTRGISAIVTQAGLSLRRTGGLVIDHKRPRPLVMILRSAD